MRALAATALVILMAALWSAALVPLTAHAANSNINVQCTSSISGMNFGVVDTHAGSGINGNFNYTCINYSSQAVSVTLCVNIGQTVWGGGYTNRYLTDGSGNSLQMQIYQDSARTLPWGSSITGGQPMYVPISLGAPTNNNSVFDKVSGSLPVYGWILGGQDSAPAGSYQATFSGYDSYLSHGTDIGSACNGGSQDGALGFTATATVAANCTVGVTPMDFGAPTGLLTTNQDSQATVTVKCPSNVSWIVGLDNGQNASGTTRRMRKGASEYVTYELYRNSGRTLRWGNTSGVDTVNGTGNGTNQAITVYGRVAPQATPSAGTYNDTITVTMWY